MNNEEQSDSLRCKALFTNTCTQGQELLTEQNRYLENRGKEGSQCTSSRLWLTQINLKCGKERGIHKKSEIVAFYLYQISTNKIS